MKNLVNIVVTLSGLPFDRGYSATSSASSRRLAFPAQRELGLLAFGEKDTAFVRRWQRERRARIGDSGRGTRFRAGHLLGEENCRQDATERKDANNFIAVTCYASGTAVANPFLINIIRAMLRLLPILSASVAGSRSAEQKPSAVSIRLHAEGNPREGETFRRSGHTDQPAQADRRFARFRSSRNATSSPSILSLQRTAPSAAISNSMPTARTSSCNTRSSIATPWSSRWSTGELLPP